MTTWIGTITDDDGDSLVIEADDTAVYVNAVDRGDEGDFSVCVALRGDQLDRLREHLDRAAMPGVTS